MHSCFRYANQIHRLRIECSVKLKTKDFMQNIQIWMEGGSEGRRRRLRNLSEDFSSENLRNSNERILNNIENFDTTDVGHPINNFNKPPDKDGEMPTRPLPMKSAGQFFQSMVQLEFFRKFPDLAKVCLHGRLKFPKMVSHERLKTSENLKNGLLRTSSATTPKHFELASLPPT